MAARTKTDWSASCWILSCGGERLLHAGKQVANTLDNAQRGRVAVFDYSGQNASAAILTNDVGLRNETFAHVRDISDDRWSSCLPPLPASRSFLRRFLGAEFVAMSYSN